MVLNGEVVGAFANLRQKQPDGSFVRWDSGGLSLGVDGDSVELRRIGVRDITALPPEVVAAASKKLPEVAPPPRPR